MSVARLLLQFGLRSVFDVGTKEIFAWIDERFADSSRAMPRAVAAANQKAWQVVGLAVAEDTFGTWLRDFARDGDAKAAREQVRAVVENTPNALALAPADLRDRAVAELASLRARSGTPAGAELDAAAATLKAYADVSGVADEAVRAAAAVPDELAPHAPHLAAVLRLDFGGTPLFEAMFRHFLRALVSKDEDLSRRLTHDQLRAIAVTLDTRTAGILDQIDIIFDAIDGLGVKVDVGFAGMGQKLDAGFGGVSEDLREIKARLAQPRKAGVSYHDADEEKFLLDAREQFRRNRGRVTAEQWGQLGDAMAAAQMYDQAAEVHETAAATAHAARDTAAEAENHYKAYLAACEGGDWKLALECLREAIGLNPTRYRPFDLDRFEIVEILGGGAYGVVFRCRDANGIPDDDGREPEVAIKVFREDVVGAALDHALAEAQTLKSLKHPCVIGVEGRVFGDQAARLRPALVLEYFPGRTLDTTRSLTVAEVVAIARQVAAALHAAHTHTRPVFHRDLKPSNVMVRENADGTWTVKVIDFGLAVRAGRVAAASRSTKDRSVTGTLKYAPPEQTGDLPDVPVGPYSDVYAFGKTFLQMLFGHTAPQNEEWAELAKLYPPAPKLRAVLDPCVRHSVKGTVPRFPNFEPVLAGLAALDPATPPTPVSPPPASSPKFAPRPAATSKPQEAEEIPFAELLDVEPSPPPPRQQQSQQQKETIAQKLKRLKAEAADKHDRARQALARYDYAAAVRILSDFTDEQLPYRDNALLADATVKRDRLAALAQAIDAHLARNLVHHSRLPVLLAEYLELNPAHAEWRELADELPKPETLPTDPQPGQVFTLRAWLPEPEHRPGELVALRWKAVPKRPNPNALLTTPNPSEARP